MVGSTIHLNGTPFTWPAWRRRPSAAATTRSRTDLWVPLMAYDVVRPRGIKITTRGWGWLSATARLKPGVTIEQAQADVDRIVTASRATFPGTLKAWRFTWRRRRRSRNRCSAPRGRVLLFALLAAALALAAACANVANVQLATVFDRRREIAVRIAMGASRARIARQWLTESLVVSIAAVVVGTIGGMWLQAAAAAIGPPAGLSNFSPADGFDLRLIMFSAAIVFAITVLFGGLPALRAARVGCGPPLKEDDRDEHAGARRAWAQAVLVAAQVAVSVALVMSGAMLARSLSASRAFDVGFDTANLMIATPTMANVGFDADARPRLLRRHRRAHSRAARREGRGPRCARAARHGRRDRPATASMAMRRRTARRFVSIANNFVLDQLFRRDAHSRSGAGAEFTMPMASARRRWSRW